MSLREKSSKIDFSAIPPAAVPAVGGQGRAKTAPGALMAHAHDQRSELLQENETLKVEAARAVDLAKEVDRLNSELREWDGVRATKRLDPKLVVRSRWANRDGASFADADYLTLKREIEGAGGNVQAIKVRPIQGPSGDTLYEIVFGHRRHQACLELGLPVLAVIESITDIELFAEMDRENRSRKDLSAWEQGVMYLRALDEGLFPSQRRLADAVGADLANVGKALRLARLPSEVVAAFASPLDLQYRYAQALDEAVQRDAEALIQRAKSLAAISPKLPAKAVFEALTQRTSEGGSTVLPPLNIEVAGQRVCEIRVGAKGRVGVEFEPGVVDPKRIKELATMVEQFLKKKARHS